MQTQQLIIESVTYSELIKDLKNLIKDEFFKATKEPETKPDEKILSLKEVANRYGVSLQTINSWLRKGKLQYRKIGGRCYVLESSLPEKNIKIV